MSKAPPPGPGKSALIKSVVLHVLALALIIIVPALNMPEPKQPQSIQAVIVNARDLAPVKPVDPKPEPQPEPEPEKLLEPVPEPKPEPKPEPVKPQEKPKPEPKETPTPLPKAENKKPVAKAETKPEPKVEPKPEPKPQPKPEKKPPKPLISADDEMAEIEKQTAAAKKQQLDAQHKAEMAALQRAAEASANAVRQKADAAIVAKYTQLIKARTQGKWVRPLSARKGMTAILRITTLPGGEVTNVNIVQGSGDAAFDASAEQAVRKASPLPVPDDVEVYNSNFRSFSFKFNPEDL